MSVFMGINTMFWNCQGVRSKREELELYLTENNFDIVALKETFLTKKIDFKIQGYDTIKNDRSTGVRGGVAFLVKHGLVINKEYRNADFNIITYNFFCFRMWRKNEAKEPRNSTPLGNSAHAKPPIQKYGNLDTSNPNLI